MSRYDDPDALRRFQEAIDNFTLSRYEPPTKAKKQDVTETVAAAGVEEPVSDLTSSLQSLEIPAHMYRATHDVRQAFSGADAHDASAWEDNLSTSPVSPEAFHDTASNTEAELYGQGTAHAKKNNFASYEISGMQAPPPTPESNKQSAATSNGNANGSSKSAPAGTVAERRRLHMNNSIHAPVSEGHSLDASYKTSALGSSWDSVLPLELKQMTPWDVTNTGGRSPLNAEAPEFYPAKPEKLEFKKISVRSPPPSKDLDVDAKAFQDAVLAFSAAYNKRARAADAQAEVRYTREIPKMEAVEDLHVEGLDSHQRGVVQACARAGCLQANVAKALDLPVEDVSPPGKGVKEFQLPRVPAQVSTGSGAPRSAPQPDTQRITEHTTYFAAWPSTQARAKPAAKIRRVRITHLPFPPPANTAHFIASLLYGGKIEDIRAGISFAEVLFVDAEACERFCKDTENGLVYGVVGGREKFVLTDMARDVDVLASRIGEVIEGGGRRCVGAIGLDLEIKLEDLEKRGALAGLRMLHVVDETTEKGVSRSLHVALEGEG